MRGEEIGDGVGGNGIRYCLGGQVENSLFQKSLYVQS